MADNAAVAAVLERAMRAGDFGAMMRLAQDSATTDFVMEWPQSGERLTKDGALRLLEHYGEETGTSPSFSFRRMIGGGSVYVIEGTIDYGDGVPVSYVGVAELRDGAVARMTEYFANPFEAPDWRAGFVERM